MNVLLRGMLGLAAIVFFQEAGNPMKDWSYRLLMCMGTTAFTLIAIVT